MKANSWVVVANQDKARIFHVEKVGVLKELEGLVQPEGTLKAQDLTSDRNGRGFDSIGAGRHAKEPKTTPKEKEAHQFAKKLSQHLHSCKSNGDYENLYLMCDPKFLGMLRQELDPKVSACVAAEIQKDMLHMKPDAIWGLLPNF